MTPQDKAAINAKIDAKIWMAENVFAKNMKYWRDKLGWTQQQMADELTISRAWYNQTEKGKVSCERVTALAFAYIITKHFDVRFYVGR